MTSSSESDGARGDEADRGAEAAARAAATRNARTAAGPDASGAAGRSASGGAALAALAGFAATLWLYWPGFMTWDSTFQFAQVVSGEVENPHPPLMVYVWMLANALVYGPGGMLVLQAAAYWTGLALIAVAVTRSAPSAAVLVLALGLFPPLFATIAMIWKDTGCLAFLLLATGLALQAARRREARLGTAAVVACGLAAAFYASALRSPNLPSALPLVWLLCGALPAFSHPAGRRLATVAVVAAGFAFGILLLDHVGVKRLPYRAAVPLWDLARMSIARGELLLPAYARDPSLDLERLRRISRDFRCDVYDPADGEKPSTDVSFRNLSDEEADRLMRDWSAAIAAHPGDYLRHRGHVTRLLFTEPMMPVWHQMESIHGFAPGVEFHPRPPYRRVHAALLWSSRHGLFTPWVYAVLAAGVLAASFAVRSTTAREARAVALSALLYVAPLPVIAPSTDFRYSIWLVAGSLVALVLLVAGTRRSAATQAASA